MNSITLKDIKDYTKGFLKDNPDMPDFDLMNWNISRMMATKEEEILLKVAEQFLGRKPIPEEDGPKFQKIFRVGTPNDYTLAYLGVSLGVIRRFYEGNSYNITFTPKNEIK